MEKLHIKIMNKSKKIIYIKLVVFTFILLLPVLILTAIFGVVNGALANEKNMAGINATSSVNQVTKADWKGFK